MPYNFTVSPDFNPDYLSGWFIFNTWLQRAIDEHIHLELYDDFNKQRQAIANDEVDLIYANPFDASKLVREKGFEPIAYPNNASDEAIIVVPADSPLQSVSDLKPGTKISKTDDPDVNLICMLMLEPADLTTDNTESSERPTYVLVAKDLINNSADIGFFLADTFQDLSGTTRKQLRPLVESNIHDVHHVFLVGPKMNHKRNEIAECLTVMQSDEKGQGVLKSLGMTNWSPMEQEDVEFMIDLMDTLDANS